MIPQTKEIILKNIYDGDELVKYITHKLQIDESEVWKLIYECFLSEGGSEDAIINMIIEEEDFCNDEGTRSDIFRTINQDFGGDIVVSFMSDYIILSDGGSITEESQI